MPDPTYDKELIDANPVWKLAFLMSETDNDNAPIGWSAYIRIANGLTLAKEKTIEILNSTTE